MKFSFISYRDFNLSNESRQFRQIRSNPRIYEAIIGKINVEIVI